MKSFLKLIGHPLVLASFGVVVLIALGSIFYYVEATRSPVATWSTASRGAIAEVVTGSGTVSPAQNPDLAFASGGRVASVAVAVGDTVAQGEMLASLDTAALRAQRAQAAANLAAAQAKLDEMRAGPRATDVSVKQTAVDQAKQALANLYANIPATLSNAYEATYSGVRSDTDTLFAQPTSPNPTLVFQTTNSQAAIDVDTMRTLLNTQLPHWQSTVDALSSATAPADLENAIQSSLAQLSSVRDYSSRLLEALTGGVPSATFPQSSIAAAQTSVAALNSATGALILSLQGAEQQLASGKLVVTAAQNALDQVLAGSTPQDIEAQQAQVAAVQASVEAIDAQIQNAVVVAPFAGTVSSVGVKKGEIVSPDTVAVSLTPQSALQVEAYLSEVDAAKLAVGDPARVTLDAYGSGRTFSASVSSIDRSPTMQSGTPAYKTTLQFTANDAAIALGMTANVSIVAAQKAGALIIPKSAVLQNGSASFVLVPGGNGPVEKQIETGIVGTSTVEVTAGLGDGDRFLTNTQ